MPLPEGTSILEELEIEEVSLVDNPANPEAMVTIYKMDSGELERIKADLLKEAKRLIQDKVSGAVSFAEMEEAIYAVLYDARKRAGDPPSTEDAMTDLEKAEAARKEAEDKLAELTAKVDELEKAKDAAEAKAADLEKAAKPEPEPEPLPENVQKAINASAERAERAEKEIAKLKDERDLSKAITKAKTEYPNAGPSDELGAMVHAIRKSNPEEADKLEEKFRAMSEQLAKGNLFLVKGADGVMKDRGTTSEDPSDIADHKARELMKSNDKLSYADALAKVMKENPELYEAQRQNRVVVGKARNA